jgi:hypothetical protein
MGAISACDGAHCRSSADNGRICVWNVTWVSQLQGIFQCSSTVYRHQLKMIICSRLVLCPSFFAQIQSFVRTSQRVR